MSRIQAESLVYLAVGVPETNRTRWQAQAVDTLERRGFAVMVMMPGDILAQADHIRKTYEKAKDETT